MRRRSSSVIPPSITEKELREKCIGITMEDLVEELVVKHNTLAAQSKLSEELFMSRATKEAAERKVQALESEGHTLLRRTMQSEEKVLTLLASLEALKLDHQQLQQSSGVGKADAKELAELRTEVEGLRDAKSLVKAERQKAAEHNELRLSVEHAFNELSRQHDELLKQLDDAQSESRTLREKCRVDANMIVVLNEDRDKQFEELEARREANSDAIRREQFAKDELAAVQKKATGWKADASRTLNMESKCSALEKANERQSVEIKSLQAQLKQAHHDALEFEEERKEWLVEQKKQEKFVKQQVGEMQGKQSFTLLDKEKSWLKERSELQLKVKQLLFEQGKKNPSKLRLMELEIQNELLLGMLQNNNGGGGGGLLGTKNSTTRKTTTTKTATPVHRKSGGGGLPPPTATAASGGGGGGGGAGGGKAHYGGSPVPAPKILPPLEKSVGSLEGSRSSGSFGGLTAALPTSSTTTEKNKEGGSSSTTDTPPCPPVTLTPLQEKKEEENNKLKKKEGSSRSSSTTSSVPVAGLPKGSSRSLAKSEDATGEEDEDDEEEEEEEEDEEDEEEEEEEEA